MLQYTIKITNWVQWQSMMHRINPNVVFACRVIFCLNINLSPRRNSTGSCGQWQKLQPAVPSKNYPVSEIIVVFYHRFVRHKGITLKCVVYLSLLFRGTLPSGTGSIIPVPEA
jgi:hypothetical protein